VLTPPPSRLPSLAIVAVHTTAKGKKSKAVSKAGTGVVRQWDILKMMVDEVRITDGLIVFHCGLHC